MPSRASTRYCPNVSALTMTGSRRGWLILDQFVAMALIGWTVWAATTTPTESVRDVALLAAGAGTVAIRRITPEIACGLTIAALAATQDVGTTRILAVTLALLLDFYVLGRRCDTSGRTVAAAVLLVAPVVVLIVGPTGGSVFNVTASWTFACALPFAAGRAIDHHDAVTVSLRAWTGRLARDQKEQLAEAAGMERARVARELHDVIAHNVSVMVIQAVAARRIAQSDRDGAVKALDTVEACGRDAVREMRRLVGVLHRNDLDPLDVASRGLEDLGHLAERAESAGLAVTVQVQGQAVPLPAALELTARRVLQEALTNAIRYAAPASATVTVTYADNDLELDVCDSGRGRGTDGPAPLPMGGKGLIGMRERVAAEGGELTAGPTPGGGFRVHARLPLQTALPSAPRRQAASSRPGLPDRPARSRWFDAILAGLLFVACEAQLLTSWQHRGSIGVETAILIGLTAPVAVRRRAPVAAAAVIMTFLLLAAATPLNAISPDAMLFVLLIPPYSAGAYARRGPALAGLAVCAGAWLALIAATTVGPPAWEVLSTGLIAGAWATGRAIGARRRTAGELSRTAAVISSQAEDLARLAVADERARIARRLQAAVARSVADMIIQTRAARILLDTDPAAADAALGQIDLTGRRALDEMRELLGVLRDDDAEPELGPQPGVGQLPGLVESVRNRGCDIELRVDGEPRPIPALCDLGVYRIAEEALRTLAASPGRRPAKAALTVTFGETWIALDVRTASAPGYLWPTPLMAERAALSGGTIECGTTDTAAVCLRVELRTAPEEALL
jgi:signal transduction histidine kinase